MEKIILLPLKFWYSHQCFTLTPLETCGLLPYSLRLDVATCYILTNEWRHVPTCDLFLTNVGSMGRSGVAMFVLPVLHSSSGYIETTKPTAA